MERPTIDHDEKLARFLAAIGHGDLQVCECGSENAAVSFEEVSGREMIIYQCRTCQLVWTKT